MTKINGRFAKGGALELNIRGSHLKRAVCIHHTKLVKPHVLLQQMNTSNFSHLFKKLTIYRRCHAEALHVRRVSFVQDTLHGLISPRLSTFFHLYSHFYLHIFFFFLC
jgi:hypothetical protein